MTTREHTGRGVLTQRQRAAHSAQASGTRSAQRTCRRQRASSAPPAAPGTLSLSPGSVCVCVCGVLRVRVWWVALLRQQHAHAAAATPPPPPHTHIHPHAHHPSSRAPFSLCEPGQAPVPMLSLHSWRLLLPVVATGCLSPGCLDAAPHTHLPALRWRLRPTAAAAHAAARCASHDRACACAELMVVPPSYHQ
jgi:hypothetical protein